LQPSLYSTNKKLTHWEEKLLNSLKNEYIGFSEYNENLYSILRLSIAKYSNNKFSYLDCDNAISNEEKSVFVDHVHFGTRGNKLIAQFLFKNIKQKLLLTQK